ncbi:DUF5675 family protein [Halopseudomonas salegens]|uniref:DUF5675 domain-containing protein n=1 Tax=Halopseudomonas salegens TaxID=1434072 RepID=A0A1H2E147_9GAMM|nr:DUF5675 family protein [Halopseudomonas salegens]SDT88767.1 hypothetical protein SAMN05216210_0201 [Halopseudomonas salegens]
MGCRIKLVRTTETAESFISDLYLNGIKIGYALELPWKDNQEFISCIPAGQYTAFIRKAETSKWSHDTIQLHHVPERSAIQIHRGNFPDDTDGCILPGTSKGQNSVGSSRIALDKIMAAAVDAGIIFVEISEQSK